VEKPYIKNKSLIIPSQCHPKYKYWDGGQTVLDSLDEIEADEVVKEKYRHMPGMKKN